MVENIGSPPLTRGIHTLSLTLDLYTGFTPAHAGNTIDYDIKALIEEVHPRSRGEYRLTCQISWVYRGSPPLTRGIH